MLKYNPLFLKIISKRVYVIVKNQLRGFAFQYSLNIPFLKVVLVNYCSTFINPTGTKSTLLFVRCSVKWF